MRVLRGNGEKEQKDQRDKAKQCGAPKFCVTQSQLSSTACPFKLNGSDCAGPSNTTLLAYCCMKTVDPVSKRRVLSCSSPSCPSVSKELTKLTRCLPLSKTSCLALHRDIRFFQQTGKSTISRLAKHLSGLLYFAAVFLDQRLLQFQNGLQKNVHGSIEAHH